MTNQTLRLNDWGLVPLQKETVEEILGIVRQLKTTLEYQRALGIMHLWRGGRGRQLFENTSNLHSVGLEEVRRELGDCKRCRLHSTRKNIVFGAGNHKADLVLVGEAPGREEDIQGEPFVGQAGKLLDRMLKAINLRRQDVYICNIVKCRPPDNRYPRSDEIDACKPFLIKQLEGIEPRIICTLGTLATHILLETKESISRLRGGIHRYCGAKLIPTYHPAYLLRNPDKKREAWEDMQLIREEYKRIRGNK